MNCMKPYSTEHYADPYRNTGIFFRNILKHCFELSTQTPNHLATHRNEKLDGNRVSNVTSLLCCSVLQCVAVCCSVLQCVAESLP